MEKGKSDFKKFIGISLIIIIAYWAINNFSIIGNIFSKIVSILFPFILGSAIAFILNLPMTFLENKFSILKQRLSKKNKKNIINKKSKVLRIFAIIFALIVISLIIMLIFKLIVPELVNVVELLIQNVPYYTDRVVEFVNKIKDENPDIEKIFSGIDLDTNSLKDKIMAEIPKILTSSISVVGNVFGVLADVVIAIIFAIYILMDKEKLKEQAKKIIISYCSKEKANKIFNVCKIANNTFKNFFTVQCLEAIILGSLCIIGMIIFRLPYAVPIGILVGVTALIPVVGAFIGIIIGAILIVSVSPIKVVTFVIFVLVLQQIEGNVIYPRVVGTSVGLPGMWVLFAVTVGGSLGGVLGMLIGVPIFSVIYTLLKKDVNKKANENIKP